ncbi:MAG: protocatechuate 3,4-dioxygenase subunit alpha [Paracoccaceae bacterium]
MPPHTRLFESPSQTAGPYVHIGCTPAHCGIRRDRPDFGRSMISGPVEGQQITISGVLYDGTSAPIPDAMIEIWQADAAGRFPGHDPRGQAAPNFTGWGRAPSDPQTGAYRFTTVKPGRVPWPDGTLQAPHVSVWLVARGINVGLQTRFYFDDEPDANAEDPILKAINDGTRIPSLLAHRTAEGQYRFDIYLQGPQETVFFDI